MPRILALLLIGLALAGASVAFTMSITAPGTNIANLALMAERQNILLVSAVAFLAGVIVLAADHVRAGTPSQSPARWRFDGATARAVGHIQGARAVISARWRAWAGNATITALALVYVLLGVHWQNEWLTFLPFWALMAWRLWKARLFSGGSLIGAAAIVFGIAAVSLIFAIVFVSENEPEFPTLSQWNQMAGPIHSAPFEAQLAQASADYRVASDKWYAEHGTTLLGFAYAQLAVTTGAALLATLLAARSLLNRRRKASSCPG